LPLLAAKPQYNGRLIDRRAHAELRRRDHRGRGRRADRRRLLAKEGKRVVVLDRSPYIGGRAMALPDEGFIVNLGGHLIEDGGSGITKVFEHVGKGAGARRGQQRDADLGERQGLGLGARPLHRPR
jgi:hypothetical protein